jgi:cyclophilin family peptidyl-prolyl cis-trans isomerase
MWIGSRILIVLGAMLVASTARAQIGGCIPDFSDPIQVSVETSVGTMILELYPNMAPATVANFVAYMERGVYDGAIFHRSVPGFVIQGGGFRGRPSSYEAIPTDPPIPNEPCLSNTAGTIAMARLGGQPDSATSQWFVNLVDNTFLDSTDGEGFAAFCRVVFDGMDVAGQIAALPVEDTLTILELPFNQIFRALPLQALPTEPPGGYGCAARSPLYGLASETIDTVIIDPQRNGGAVVPILLDPACTGAGAAGPPSVVCTPGVGREVFQVDLESQVFFQPRTPMTCDAVAEAEDSWAARRAGTAPQYLALDVEMLSVPEPFGLTPSGAGLVALAALARARGRTRR